MDQPWHPEDDPPDGPPLQEGRKIQIRQWLGPVQAVQKCHTEDAGLAKSYDNYI